MNAKEREALLATLKARFEKNRGRHAKVEWGEVEKRLAGKAEKLEALGEMERTGGEPDVVGRDAKTGEILFVDCAAESPKGRRSVCYDPAALALQAAVMGGVASSIDSPSIGTSP